MIIPVDQLKDYLVDLVPLATLSDSAEKKERFRELSATFSLTAIFSPLPLPSISFPSRISLKPSCYKIAFLAGEASSTV